MGSPCFPPPQFVRDFAGSMQNHVFMEFLHALPTVCRWSCWVNAGSCVDGVSPFFAHREYVLLLDRRRIMCWWDLPVFHPQEVRDLVGSVQNRVLMESPHSSPAESMWSCWINAESRAHGIHSSPTASTWSLWINAESCAHRISPFFTQRVRDLVGSMQIHVLMRSPYVSPTACMWSCWRIMC